MRICIIIPVYNEASTIAEMIEQIKMLNLDAVVIDDGSSDGCGQIARTSGAIVLTHSEKKGKGVSLRDGFSYAIKEKYDGVITMDGDGQHAVSDIKQFVEAAREFSDGIVVGNRMDKCDNMPLLRRLTNRFMSLMISAICRQRIPDSQNGFRFIGSRILRKIQLSSSDFEIETEVLIKASRKGFRIHSIPVQTIYSNESSKINPFVDTVRFFVFIIRALWNKD